VQQDVKDHETDPLAALRERARGRSFVVAQLGQSLDGRIATPSGESQWINGACALDHVHRLRAAVDAVIVGVGTVMADNPRLDVRRVEGRNPARVVIDPQGRMPADKTCLRADGTRRIVVRCRPGPCPDGLEEVVIARGGQGDDAIVSPRAILSRLLELGLECILVEGGARTISAFLAAGCVDRLHVLVAPMILGSGQVGLDLPPIMSLSEALRPRTRVYPLPDGDVLFDCSLAPEPRHDC
jgi:diaminohydroxyphosphoribosylaminopyrimidine deaminase / 5-amino-6-(5-phosphoribosylamino)uracil reductase